MLQQLTFVATSRRRTVSNDKCNLEDARQVGRGLPMQLKRVAGSHMSTRIFKLGVGDAPHVDELAFILHADCNSRLTLPTCFACCACIPASNKKLQKRTSQRLRCRHKIGQSLRCKQETPRTSPSSPRTFHLLVVDDHLNDSLPRCCWLLAELDFHVALRDRLVQDDAPSLLADVCVDDR